MGEQHRQATTHLSLGQRLRRERERHNWSQEQLADALGNIVSISSINRWEHDKVVPRPYYREQLCRAFNLSHDALFGTIVPDSSKAVASMDQAAITPLWTVPYLRNRYFTGRDEVLTRLHATLTTQKTVALTALSGLGGIGKTQTALEYTYRYSEEYDAIVWAHAESLPALISDYVVLADLLHLPEREEAEQRRVVAAVVRWLQHTSRRWLLILDNVEHLDQVTEFLPTRGSGHTLLTTRSQAMGTAIESIEMDAMSLEEGTEFLLRRARLLGAEVTLERATESERKEAETICKELGGLPLALDQAGAYIEENQCRLEDYQRLYQTKRKELLRRRGQLSLKTSAHVVATTWNLSFEQIEQVNAAAADLLRLCAFLHPDGIPEALLLAAGAALGPVLQPLMADPYAWDEAIGVLRSYSLMRRKAEMKALMLHRLVQAVLKDAMAPEVYQEWAERAVRVVGQAFPEVEFASWPTCQQYLPQALVCADLIQQRDIRIPEAAHLLYRSAHYLYKRGHYTEAEPLFQRALITDEHVWGPEHPDTAQSLNDLAELYWHQGKYAQAEPLYLRALAIWEQALGTEHPDSALAIHNLASLYYMQGKYAQAEPLWQRALAIRERTRGPDHPDTAQSLNNLAMLYRDQGKYAEGESLMQRVLTILKQALGTEHPFTALALHNLAMLYRDQAQYELAQPLFERAHAIRARVLGPTHSDTALSIHGLARLHHDQGQFEQAESLYQQALAIWEQGLGVEHPNTALALHNLARLYRDHGKYEQAQPLFARALAIRTQVFGPTHPDTARILYDLALLYRNQGREEEAEPLFAQAQEILGQHPIDATHPQRTGSMVSTVFRK